MPYGYFKDLTIITTSDKKMRSQAFNIPKKFVKMDANVDLLPWCLNILMKKAFGGTINDYFMSNDKLTEEIHKPVNIKLKKSILFFYKDYLVYGSDWYAINK